MKTYTSFLTILLAMIFCQNALAQDDREDVIYLKNGAIYRGVIVEQIPGESYKIEIAGGSVIKIAAQDVLRVVKEPKVRNGRADRRDYPDDEKGYSYRKPRRDREEHEFVYRDKGYFFQGQIVAGFFEIGTRVINGYKFGQYGFLGLGLGIDIVMGPVNGGGGGGGGSFPFPDVNTDYAGPHIPLFVYYAGDILMKKITPFYAVELGYAFRPGSTDAYSGDSYIGGVMAAVGFGVRMNKRGRKNISLSLNLDIKNPTNKYTSTSYNQQGNPYTYTSSESMVMLMPSFKFGIGF